MYLQTFKTCVLEHGRRQTRYCILCNTRDNTQKNAQRILSQIKFCNLKFYLLLLGFFNYQSIRLLQNFEKYSKYMKTTVVLPIHNLSEIIAKEPGRSEAYYGYWLPKWLN